MAQLHLEALSAAREPVADLAAGGRDPRLVLAQARDALEQGRLDESADAFHELARHPRFAAEADYGLGWIELQEGSAEQAQARFRDVIARDPGHANAWYALGTLTEEHSVDDAIDCYRHALGADPDHFSAAQRLRLLGESPAPVATAAESGIGLAGFGQATASPGAAAVSHNAGPDAFASIADPGELGIEDFLRRDGSEIARDALTRIESLDRSTRFRISARLQQFAVRLAGLLIPAIVIGKVLYAVTPFRIGNSTIHFSSGSETTLVLAAVGVWALWGVWMILDCLTNTITIRNARIRWTRGVLNKRTETLDVWTARDVELERNLLQRLTCDGTLTFRGTTHDRRRRVGKGKFTPLHLTGVARGEELDHVYALLLDLKFLLRAHPGLKGIIQ